MLTEGSYTVAVCPWNTEEAPLVHVFSNQLICLWRLVRKMAAPHAQSPDVPMPISLSRRTRRLLAPTGLVHAAMPSLAANARQQATWLWQSMQTHQMALWYDNWVKKSYGVDPLHPDHSINCAVVVVLHLPVLPPFPGHVLLIHTIQTIGARVDALQLRHADLLRQVYALLDMIQCTVVRVPLEHCAAERAISPLATNDAVSTTVWNQTGSLETSKYNSACAADNPS